jgi:S1-C subfamily serine protease
MHRSLSAMPAVVVIRGACVALLVVTALVGAPAPAPGQDLAGLVRQVSPSVVVIRAKGREVTAAGQTRFTETGSGVLVSADGKVMTAAHVVHAMEDITVEFLGGDTVSARVVASEPGADLSLLQLEQVPAGVTVARLADSDGVQVGQQVVIIGAPYGLSYSMSAGWISARWAPNTVYRSMPLAEFFQTDATINTGNSGGPMFNLAGEVVGLVSHNISKGGGSEGLGFVVTINTAKQLLLEKKSFWGGLEGRILPDHLADLLNLPPGATGFLITNVVKGSPADEVGLRAGTTFATISGEEVVLGGDILMTVEGIHAGSVANMTKIRDRLAALPPGTPIKMTILRAGRVIDLTGRTPAADR